MSEDKRLTPRQQTSFDARYRPYIDAFYSWRPLRALDMSSSGIRFRGIDVLRPGQQFELDVMLPLQKECLRFLTRVIWCQQKSFRTIESGFELITITSQDEERISKLLEVYKSASSSRQTIT